jgi:hypothetical protein
VIALDEEGDSKVDDDHHENNLFLCGDHSGTHPQEITSKNPEVSNLTFGCKVWFYVLKENKNLGQQPLSMMDRFLQSSAQVCTQAPYFKRCCL